MGNDIRKEWRRRQWTAELSYYKRAKGEGWTEVVKTEIV